MPSPATTTKRLQPAVSIDGKPLLTPRQRRTCALAWGDGLPQADIAARQGVSRWATKKRLQRARQRLRAAGITPPGNAHGRLHRATAAQLSLIWTY